MAVKLNINVVIWHPGKKTTFWIYLEKEKPFEFYVWKKPKKTRIPFSALVNLTINVVTWHCEKKTFWVHLEKKKLLNSTFEKKTIKQFEFTF